MESDRPGPTRGGQQQTLTGLKFRLSSLFFWMTVAATLLALMRDVPLKQVPILLVVFAPPLTCVPFLLDRWLYRDERGLDFSVARRIWLILAVAAYSALALLLATIAFPPDWKGHKGLHPLFYIHDYPAGMTIWPIYALGVGSFMRAISDPRYARRSPVNLVMVATAAIVSMWYAFSVLLLKFAGDAKVLAIVPGSVGICYSIYCGIIVKYANFRPAAWRASSGGLTLWLGATVAAILAKYPLALRVYEALPDKPPQDCFIVTAASRGSPRWVGSWRDAASGRLLNRQLLVFWGFETWLKVRVPRTHRFIRFWYNWLGPLVARTIRFRWQANVVFLLLKPAEWLAARCLVGPPR